MEKQKVIEAAKILNEVMVANEEGKEVPLIENKIKIVAVKEEALVVAFMKACNSIPEDKEECIPDAVAEVYNAIAKEMENKDKDDTAPAPAAATKKEKKEKKQKAEGATKRQPPKRDTDAWGNAVGTMSELINAMLVKGAKKDDIAASLQEKFGKNDASAKSKVDGHIRFLKSKGFAVTEKDGIYTLAKVA
jgi:hypothetical protein